MCCVLLLLNYPDPKTTCDGCGLCERCPPGSYSAGGFGACIKCQLGFTSPAGSVASTGCSLCPAVSDPHFQFRACPDGESQHTLHDMLATLVLVAISLLHQRVHAVEATPVQIRQTMK